MHFVVKNSKQTLVSRKRGITNKNFEKKATAKRDYVTNSKNTSSFNIITIQVLKLVIIAVNTIYAEIGNIYVYTKI